MIINFNDKSNLTNNFNYWHICRRGSWCDKRQPVSEIHYMKINVNNSSFFRKHKWITQVVMRFSEAHDVEFGSNVKQYISSPIGSKILAEWMKSEGWRVAHWELPPIFDKSIECEVYLAYGLEFDDDCPKLIEALLKQ